jgi:hypothetical protein
MVKVSEIKSKVKLIGTQSIGEKLNLEFGESKKRFMNAQDEIKSLK